MEITLASASPRRLRLLEQAGLQVRVAPTHVDETLPPGVKPAEGARLLAERKARAAEGHLILAADTIVVLDGEIIGKPRDAADAVAILTRLSNREHEVITGVAVRRMERVVSAVQSTSVRFRALTPEDIAAYVATGEPLDKAGAYGIQGGAKKFVVELDGPVDNVIGLPVALALRLLRELGYR